MRKIFIVSLVILVIPSIYYAAQAEPTDPNEVGLYTEPNGYGATGTSVIGSPVDVFLVLTRPRDVANGNVPYQTHFGFALQMHFDPVPDDDLLLLEAVLPPGHVDIGRYEDINEGILEYVVAWGAEVPMPVVDDAAVLMVMTFLNATSGVTAVTLHPIPDAPGVEGEMVFLGGGAPPFPPGTSFPQTIMYPVSGSNDAPVFLFNGEAVAVENESFGSVKALYR